MIYSIDNVEYQSTVLMRNYETCLEAIIISNQFYEFTNGIAAWCEPTEILRPVKRPKIRPIKEVN
jgi:hypothetical protein